MLVALPQLLHHHYSWGQTLYLLPRNEPLLRAKKGYAALR